MLEINEVLVIALLCSFIALIFTGFPVAWALAGVSVLFSFIAIWGFELLDWDTYFLTDMRIFGVMVQRIWGQMSNWILVALPMFIFMGLMLERSGITEKLMANFIQLFGRYRGGLALGVVMIGILLAASTGIVGASVVLLALLSMPIMMQQGYNKAFASGVVCSAGTLGILIPPSIMLIIMADQMSVSVGNLFMGALFPGLMLGGLYLVFILIAALVFVRLAPAPKDLPPVSLRLVLSTLWAVVPPLSLIVLVLGSIFFGFATPTEAAGVGAFGATVLAALNGRLSFAVLKDVGMKTSLTTAFIFGIFLGATMFAVVMRQLGGDEFISGLLAGLPFPPGGIVLTILFIAFMAGFFLDWLEISLIMLPLVTPVVALLGFDPIWFIVLFAVTLQTSFLTPPVGFSLFYFKGVAPAGVKITDIYLGVLPFVAIQILAVLLVFLYPQIVLWLPGQMLS